MGTMHHLPARVRRFFESFPWTLQRLQAFIQSACFGEHTSEPDVERVEHEVSWTMVSFLKMKNFLALLLQNTKMSR